MEALKNRSLGQHSSARGHCPDTADSSWLVGGSGGVRLVLGASELVLTAALPSREALLAEMGVAMREDGGTLGVFSPKKVGAGPWYCASVVKVALPLVDDKAEGVFLGGGGSKMGFWPRHGPALIRLSVVSWVILVSG